MKYGEKICLTVMPPDLEIYTVGRVVTRREDYHGEIDHGTDLMNLRKIGNIDYDTAEVDHEMMNKRMLRERSAIALGQEMTYLSGGYQKDPDRETTPTRMIGMKPMNGTDPDHETSLRNDMTDEEEKTIWKDGRNRETGPSETKKMKEE